MVLNWASERIKAHMQKYSCPSFIQAPNEYLWNCHFTWHSSILHINGKCRLLVTPYKHNSAPCYIFQEAIERLFRYHWGLAPENVCIPAGRVHEEFYKIFRWVVDNYTLSTGKRPIIPFMDYIVVNKLLTMFLWLHVHAGGRSPVSVWKGYYAWWDEKMW